MRRAGAIIAAIIAATVLPAITAYAATCAPLPAANNTTRPEGADWILFAFVIPYGGDQVRTDYYVEFDHIAHSAASGWMWSPPGPGEALARVTDLQHPERNDVVRIGNHAVARRGRQPLGSGDRYAFGGGSSLGTLKPCSVETVLVFVPGARVIKARTSIAGAAEGHAITYAGRGGGALLATDSRESPAIAAGAYFGKFKVNWSANKGLVGSLAENCSCKGVWKAPNGRTSKFAFGSQDFSLPIAGPPGRWQINLVSDGGGDMTGAPLIGAWADLGDLRTLVRAPEVE